MKNWQTCVDPPAESIGQQLITFSRPQARTAYQSLNGFHLQDRYLVGKWSHSSLVRLKTSADTCTWLAVLYHQPKIQGAKDLARREAELEKQKKAHGID